jgi:hypothetical protein
MHTRIGMLLIAFLIGVSGCGKAPAKTPHGAGGAGGSGGGGGSSGGGQDMGPSDGGTVPDGYFAPSSLTVSGQIDDFETAQPLGGPGTMTTAALTPPPSSSVSGATFTITSIPPFSSFFLIAGGPPDHVPTYNPPVTITNHDLTGAAVLTVGETYLQKLRTAFAITAQSGTATVLVRAVDSNDKPLAGVAGSAFTVGGSFGQGPYFLDATLQPATSTIATSSSGWLVYFNVPPGTVSLKGASGYTVSAADTPTGGDSVSIITATVSAMPAAPLPKNPSFTHDIVPIFVNRGCINCHSGNGPGRTLGGLVLDGAPNKIWTALVQTISPNFNETRVNLKDPPKSLVLTMPSYENPPDAHPTVIFQSSADPDYQKILAWIVAGALNDSPGQGGEQ